MNIEKLKQEFKESEGEWKTQAAGIVLLTIFILISYSVGRSEGRQAAEAELPQLSSVTQKIDRIEKAMLANRDCSNTISQSARSQP